jgi:hypothetical protein
METSAGPIPSDLCDPELIALPAPPRRERTIAAALMITTAVASSLMCWALRSEVSYAFARPVPVDVGDLASFQPDSLPSSTYVEAKALLGTRGAIRYARPLEGDSYRLQPVAGNDRLWVEVRVPEGMEGPRFVPPTSFAGRLSPLKSSGLRHSGIASSVLKQTDVSLRPDAWILSDGSSPRASRWSVALFGLFAFFALWNVFSTIRILRRVS